MIPLCGQPWTHLTSHAETHLGWALICLGVAFVTFALGRWTALASAEA